MLRSSLSRLVRSVVYAAAVLASVAPAAAQTPGTVGLFGTSPVQGITSATGVVAIAGGGNVAGVLYADGRVQVWGRDNDWGVLDVPVGLRAKAIAAGTDFMMALRTDGTVVCWGYSLPGSLEVPEGLDHVVKICASWDQAIALKDDGTVYCWGASRNPQITTVPPEVTGAIDIAAGGALGVAILADKRPIVWGDHNSITPDTAIDLKSVSASYLHILALKEDGTVVGWNAFFGYDPDNASRVPEGLSDVKQVVAGNGFSMALKNDGTIVTWGRSVYLAERLAHLSSVTNATSIACESGWSESVLVLYGGETPLPPFPGALATNIGDLVGGTRGTYTGSVTLSAPATANTVVDLTSSDPAIGVPASVKIGKGKTSASFVFTTSAVDSDKKVTLTAKVAGTAAKTVDLNVRALTLNDLLLEVPTIEGGNGIKATVRLPYVVTNDTQIDIAVDSVPAYSVNVPAGSKSTTFYLNTPVVETPGTMNVTVSRGASSVTRSLNLIPSPVIGSINLPSGYGNEMVTGTIYLKTPAGRGGTVVLISGDSALATFPGGIMVPEGKTSIPFTVLLGDVPAKTTLNLTFSNAKSSVAKATNILPLKLVSAAMLDTWVQSGYSARLHVALNRVAMKNTRVEIEVLTGAEYVFPDGNPIVHTGQIADDIYLYTESVTKRQLITLKVSRNGISKIVSFYLNP